MIAHSKGTLHLNTKAQSRGRKVILFLLCLRAFAVSSILIALAKDFVLDIVGIKETERSYDDRSRSES
jgi:hypothetical protein